jgi:hypothetical protein
LNSDAARCNCGDTARHGMGLAGSQHKEACPMKTRRRTFWAVLLAPAAAALLASTASAAEPPASGAPRDTGGADVVELLLATAADEFKGAKDLNAVGFRNVRVGYFADGAAGRHVLCGAVQSSGPQKKEWISFATVKTSPYEQWLGGVADAICKSPKVQWRKGDLSAQLARRVRG